MKATIILKKGKSEAVKRFHPWIFSGAIHRIDDNVQDGDLVRVTDAGGAFLAQGYYQNGSIMVRIISFDEAAIDSEFWIKKLQNAYDCRRTLGLVDNPETNCFRLIHAEGDGLPGLIIDIYQHTAVIQCHAIGIHLLRHDIAKALQKVIPSLQVIYDKSSDTLPKEYALNIKNECLLGDASDGLVLENGNQFQVNWATGQKTGFFLDQRVNRQLIQQYSKGKRVLNAFCYSGGFSVYALQAGATLVHSVDVSEKAIALTDQNVVLNGFDAVTHKSFAADVMDYLRQNDQIYEVLIIDPPAYAKSMAKRHNAVQGYKRLNVAALKAAAPGAVVFTFSCSQVIDRELFYNTIVAAALEAGRQIRVLQHLAQPADHPVNIFHPEGAYLKGLVLYVD